MESKSVPVRRCARCVESIPDGEPAVFYAGAPLHLRCFSTIELVDRAAAFLWDHPGAPVCYRCLAGALCTSIGEIKKVTTALTLTSHFYVVIGTSCGLCQREAPVVEVARGRGEDGAFVAEQREAA
jgi:hypothetical protein